MGLILPRLSLYFILLFVLVWQLILPGQVFGQLNPYSTAELTKPGIGFSNAVPSSAHGVYTNTEAESVGILSNAVAFLHESSFGIATGFSMTGRHFSNGQTYRVLLHILYFRIPLIKREPEINQLVLHMEPQINRVYIGEQRHSETGFNLGLAYHRKLNEETKLTLLLSTGPHSTTSDSQIQASGFLFSDNLSLGISRRFEWLKIPIEVNAEVRFRHISNGGTQTPNRGINNTIFVVGIGRIIN